jgi:hypothetical protein
MNSILQRLGYSQRILRLITTRLWGGTKVAMYKAGEVVMKFKNEAGDLFEIKYNDMKVANTGWTRREAIYSSVSILGLDFFLKNKLSLHIDTVKDIAYIETDGSA